MKSLFINRMLMSCLIVTNNSYGAFYQDWLGSTIYKPLSNLEKIYFIASDYLLTNYTPQLFCPDEAGGWIEIEDPLNISDFIPWKAIITAVLQKNPTLTNFEQAVIAVFLMYQGTISGKHWLFEVVEEENLFAAKMNVKKLLRKENRDMAEEKDLAINFIRLLMHQDMEGVVSSNDQTTMQQIRKSLGMLSYLDETGKKVNFGCWQHKENFYLGEIIKLFENNVPMNNVIAYVNNRNDALGEWCAECQQIELPYCAFGLNFLVNRNGMISKKNLFECLEHINFFFGINLHFS